jgi:hypothetical protein
MDPSHSDAPAVPYDGPDSNWFAQPLTVVSRAEAGITVRCRVLPRDNVVCDAKLTDGVVRGWSLRELEAYTLFRDVRDLTHNYESCVVGSLDALWFDAEGWMCVEATVTESTWRANIIASLDPAGRELTDAAREDGWWEDQTEGACICAAKQYPTIAVQYRTLSSGRAVDPVVTILMTSIAGDLPAVFTPAPTACVPVQNARMKTKKGARARKTPLKDADKARAQLPSTLHGPLARSRLSRTWTHSVLVDFPHVSRMAVRQGDGDSWRMASDVELGIMGFAAPSVEKK